MSRWPASKISEQDATRHGDGRVSEGTGLVHQLHVNHLRSVSGSGGSTLLVIDIQ